MLIYFILIVFDPLTPLEETADALAQAVHHGKALYVGISSYSSKQTIIMNNLLKERGIKCLIHQPSYSMINRWIEKDLIKTLKKLRYWLYCFFSSSSRNAFTKYLKTIPKNSRAAENSSLDKKMITKSYIFKITNI